MDGSTLEAALRRDRALVAASLATVTGLAWAYTAWLAGTMDMQGGMSMAPALEPWDVSRFTVMFVMWAVMMVGMMTPSAAPMILLYARVGRQAERQGRTLAATGWFAGGYLLAWTVFSLGATAGQWALEAALLLSPMMKSSSQAFGGLLLIVAGLYQWTTLKDACLSHCQSPLVFIQRHGGFRQSPTGSLCLGLRHGLYCIGCCWALMSLLFVGGVMNLLWIALIAVFVLLEKLRVVGRWLPALAGIALVAAGSWLSMQPWLSPVWLA